MPDDFEPASATLDTRHSPIEALALLCADMMDQRADAEHGAENATRARRAAEYHAAALDRRLREAETRANAYDAALQVIAETVDHQGTHAQLPGRVRAAVRDLQARLDQSRQGARQALDAREDAIRERDANAARARAYERIADVIGVDPGRPAAVVGAVQRVFRQRDEAREQLDLHRQRVAADAPTEAPDTTPDDPESCFGWIRQHATDGSWIAECSHCSDWAHTFDDPTSKASAAFAARAEFASHAFVAHHAEKTRVRYFPRTAEDAQAIVLHTGDTMSYPLGTRRVG